jgi:hypothetical protein
MRRLALFALLTTFVPWACAQRMVSAPAHLVAPAHPAAPAFKGVRGSFARGNFAQGHGASPLSRFPRTGPFGAQFFPLLSDWLNPDDLYAAGYPIASQLPFVMQGGPSAAADSDRQPQSPHESLLIELQGDRYVRVSNSQMESAVQQLTSVPGRDAQPVAPRKNSARAPSHDSAASPAPSIAAAPSPAAPLPAVILVLRDGTLQEVHDYTIADGVLYARGDFYTDGYWNKQIALATLNLPETLSTNNTRGVRFVLPSAPNEVITRP